MNFVKPLILLALFEKCKPQSGKIPGIFPVRREISSPVGSVGGALAATVAAGAGVLILSVEGGAAKDAPWRSAGSRRRG
jgi:hypothetical protein